MRVKKCWIIAAKSGNNATIARDLLIALTALRDTKFNGVRTVFDIASSYFPIFAEMDSNEFSKSGGIIVSDSFSIPESFQHRIRTHNLIFESDLQNTNYHFRFYLLFFYDFGIWIDNHFFFLLTCTHWGEERQNFFGIFSFSCPRFPGNQHTLILSIWNYFTYHSYLIPVLFYCTIP